MRIWNTKIAAKYANVVFGTLLFGLFPMIAFGATFTQTPSDELTSGWLDTNFQSTSTWDTADNFSPKLIQPNTIECAVTNGGWASNTFSLGTGNLANMDWSVYGPYFCDNNNIPDWTQDGDWVIEWYTDDSQVTLEGTLTFCQGSSCSVPPPPTPTSTNATTTELQTIHEDLLWLLWWIVFACSFLWFERYYRT